MARGRKPRLHQYPTPATAGLAAAASNVAARGTDAISEREAERRQVLMWLDKAGALDKISLWQWVPGHVFRELMADLIIAFRLESLDSVTAFLSSDPKSIGRADVYAARKLQERFPEAQVPRLVDGVRKMVPLADVVKAEWLVMEPRLKMLRKRGRELVKDRWRSEYRLIAGIYGLLLVLTDRKSTSRETLLSALIQILHAAGLRATGGKAWTPDSIWQRIIARKRHRGELSHSDIAYRLLSTEPDLLDYRPSPGWNAPLGLQLEAVLDGRTLRALPRRPGPV